MTKIRTDFILFLYAFFTIGHFQIPLDGLLSLFLFLILLWGKRYMPIAHMMHNYKMYFFATFILAYVITASPTTSGIMLAKEVGNYTLLLTPFILYETYSMESDKTQEQVVKICQFIMAFWSGIAIAFFTAFPGNTKGFVIGVCHGRPLAIGGGQLLAYGMTIYSVFLFYRYTIGCSRRMDLLLLAETIVLDALVESAITVLAGMLGIGVVILTSHCRKMKTFKLILLGCLGLFCCDILSGGNILYQTLSTMEWSELGALGVRLKDIVNFLYEGKVRDGSSLLLRLKLYMESIENFLSAPLLGTGSSGEHSTILDALAMWGIGGILFVGIYIFPTDTLRKSRACAGVMATFISMAMFNPIMTFNVMFVMGFLIPLELKNEKTGEKICESY